MRTPRRVPSSLLRHSPLAAALACVLVTPVMGATFTVANNATFGPGSLNQAILDANAGCTGADVINFDAPYVIAASAPLPLITCGGLQINGAAAGSKAAVDGVGVFFEACAITSTASPNAIIRNLEVRNFDYGFYAAALCGGLTVLGSDLHNNSRGVIATAATVVGDGTAAGLNRIYANSESGVLAEYGGVIDGNWIGTADGATTSGQWIGAQVYASTIIRNNLISGNFIGVYAVNNGSTIANNTIGLNAAGNGIIGNVYGIDAPGAAGMVISGNVISGNDGGAINLSNASGVQITGNKIGVDASGNNAIPNGDGIFLNCSSSTSILNNQIAGNSYGGIFLLAARQGTIKGNNIGVKSDGTTLLGNAGDGIAMGFGDCIFGNTGNLIEANTIAGNGGSGILISTGSDNTIRNNVAIKGNFSHGVSIIQGAGNRIEGNSIHANGLKNINLDFDGGPLPNDALDADTGGPNERQNYPGISLVTQSGGNTLVTWSLNSEPGKSYTVEFFSNLDAGVPAGRTPIMTASATTDAAGNFPGSTSITGAWDNVSATATDLSTGNTSEFSSAVAVTPTPAVTISPNPKNFGNVIVGSSLGPFGITVTSVGSAPYVISAFDSAPTCYGGPICSSGAFICANSCATSTPYAPGASCGIDVTFAPSVLGPASTTFYICDNAAGSPRAVTLLGDGVAPPPVALSISPVGYDFGTVLVGSSAVHAFTISNPGTGDATLTGPPTAISPFEVDSTTCGAILAASASCLANVRFAPLANGNATGALTVSGSGVTASATLVGTGLRQSLLEMTSALVDLGTTTLGAAPLTQAVSLRNAGSAPLTIDRISVGPPFTLTNGCPSSLLPDETCAVTLELDPTAIGTFNASLAVVTNAPGGSRSVPVRAQVQARPEPVVRVSPASIGFGERMGGSQAPAQRINVINEGGAAATGVSLSINSPHFLIVNTTCGNVLGAQSTCFADVAFQPIGFGPKRASFDVDSNAPTASSALSGAGCRPPSASPGRGTRLSCAP
jgi:trimeric autotransporter adhesin